MGNIKSNAKQNLIMKQMKKLVLLTFIALSLFSCNDFLEEESQDQVRLKSTTSYKEFLFGEIYLGHNVPKDYYLDIMTDDVSDFTRSYGTDHRLDYYGYYTWQKEPEEGLGEARKEDNAWDHYYHQILMCNIVLHQVDEAEGLQKDITDIKGECYFLRANAYFKLVNLYGEAYVKETAASALGVPINKSIGVNDVLYQRESVEKVYKQITDDIEQSILYLKEANVQKTVFRISECAANLLASRIYLYKKEWDKVIKYANRAIELNPKLCDLKNYNNSAFINNGNPEIIFTYGANTISGAYKTYAKGSYVVAEDLLKSYEEDDLRKNEYFSTKVGQTKPSKGFLSYSDLYGFALRVSEAYLNRAEAYVGKDKADLALADIKTLRENRFVIAPEITASTPTEILDLVKNERRKELCFEQQRWFDLKRWGMDKISHSWTSDISAGIKVNYTLSENDKAYTLPIPIKVRNFNPTIKSIDRPVRKVIVKY